MYFVFCGWLKFSYNSADIYTDIHRDSLGGARGEVNAYLRVCCYLFKINHNKCISEEPTQVAARYCGSGRDPPDGPKFTKFRK